VAALARKRRRTYSFPHIRVDVGNDLLQLSDALEAK
jgi:hypothetical protein